MGVSAQCPIEIFHPRSARATCHPARSDRQNKNRRLHPANLETEWLGGAYLILEAHNQAGCTKESYRCSHNALRLHLPSHFRRGSFQSCSSVANRLGKTRAVFAEKF